MQSRLLLMLFLCISLAACSTVGSRASQEDQRKAQVNVELGLNYLGRGNLRPALKRVNKAISLDPDLASAYNVGGLIYAQLGQHDLADQYLQKAVKLSPEDPSAQNNYGKFLCSTGRFKQAEQHFLTAVKSPKNLKPEVAYTNAGLCALRIPDLDRAAQYFRAGLDTNPKWATGRYQLAVISYNKGRYPQAQRELEDYLEVGQHTPKTLLLGIRIARAQNDSQTEQSYMQQMSEQFPNSREAKEMLKPNKISQTTAAPSGRRSVSGTAPQAGANSASASTSGAPSVKSVDWVLAQDPSHFTIELITSQDKRNLLGYLGKEQLPQQLGYFGFQKNQTKWFSLIYGSFAERQPARAAMERLPADLRDHQPTIKPFSEIQSEIVAEAN